MSEVAEKEPIETLCSVELWAVSKGTSVATFAAARAHEQWPVGLELDEAAFDAAIASIKKLSLR